MKASLPLLAVSSAVLTASFVHAQDFGNLGGNAQRNGQTAAIGPISTQVAWSDDANSSIISWMPYISNDRVFVVRATGFPQAGGAANDEILSYDLETGSILWRMSLPYGGDPTTEFIAWIAGVNSGRVYAARTQNSRPGPIRALDAVTGAILWTSTTTTEAFANDGVVFTPDGDLILADFSKIERLDGATGSVEWSTPRFCPVSGSCGVAMTGDAIYFDQPAVGGHTVGKLDLATGAFLYESPIMPGFTTQNSPFVSTDGTVYFARSQNNPSTDFLYAFDDTGTEFIQRWSTPIRWTTGHEHGVAADGSVYTFNANEEFVRLDPATGQETANAGLLAPVGFSLSPQTAVDAAGTVYVSNGFASNPAGDGRLWAFNEDLSTVHFVQTFERPNQGGPAVGGDGYLVMADLNRVSVYRALEQGSAYCSPAVPNSTGQPAALTVRGDTDVAASDLVLRCASMPNSVFGYFLLSTTQGFAAGAGGSQGNLCLSGSVGRFSQAAASSMDRGSIELRIDLAAVPQPAGFVSVVAGETWNFQAWFRDAVGGMATSNFSNARSVVFQ